MDKPQEIKVADKVPLKVRMGWGLGGLADNYIMNSFIVLVMPVYNIALGMDAVLLGWATFIPRFTDAIADVWIGNMSDNTRTRWGRRRPYIFAGAILSAIVLPMLWIPPFKTDNAMFFYILTMGLVYLIIYSIYVVPYTALGYELTTDYNERTRVLAWRMYIGLFGSATVPGLYWLCLKLKNGLGQLPAQAKDDVSLQSFFIKILSFFGSGVAAAAFWMSIGLGVIILISGILPAIICRERVQSQHQARIHILSAISYTLKNRPFMILCVAYVIIIFGLFAPGTLGLYVNIYYVFGNKEDAAFLQLLSGPLSAATSYLSLFLIGWISVRWDKRRAMIMGLLFTLAGVCSAWFTMTPKMPYLQLISAFISCLGLQGCWLMVSSMVADVCDEDELNTGLRREGVYGAVNGLAMKAALSFTLIAGGVMLKLSGYDPKIAESVGSVPIEIAMRMKIFMIGGQALAITFATIIFMFYPITRQRAEKTRQILDERHRQAAMGV